MIEGIESEIEKQLQGSQILWKSSDDDDKKESIIKGLFDEYKESEIRFDKYKTGNN